MTLLELYNSVAQLGFEDSLDDGGTVRFLQAANRAILQVNSLRPRKNTFVLNHIDLTPFIETYADIVERDEDTTFAGYGVKGVYFEVCGEGEAKICIRKREKVAEDEWRTVETAIDALGNSGIMTFNTYGFKTFRYLVKSTGKFIDQIIAAADQEKINRGDLIYDVTVTFGGDCAYTVRNLAMYHTITSSDPNKLFAYGAQREYDMSEIIPDFDRLNTPPLVLYNDQIITETNYAIFGGKKLLLPASFPGVYTIEYLTKPQLISENDPMETTVIVLDEDLCALLPILIASYIWLDDEPEKAQYYYNMYMQRSAEISISTRSDGTLPFVSHYGW